MRSIRLWREFDAWTAGTVFLAVLILVPLLTAVGGLAVPGPDWRHIAETVLWTYVWNTLLLTVLVLVLSLLMAIPAAWLVSAFEFPGRRFFEWALVMPLAIPAYVAAFVYYGVPEQAIPALVWIRNQFGVGVYQATEMGLRYGLLAVLMASVLYPYLFLTARASFSQQRRAMIEAAQTLGRSPRETFFSVALPLARPALIAGLSLIAMEVINDYGAVHFFGLPTLTEGIFRTWFGLGDRASALRLSGLVMLAIWTALFLEQHLRGRARFAEQASNPAPLVRRPLERWHGVAAPGFCMLPFTLGFVYPAGQLLTWALRSIGDVLTPDFAGQLLNSLLLALLTAVGLTVLALLFAYARKLHSAAWLDSLGRAAMLGYASPGAVVAVGVMVMLAAVDRFSAAAIVDGPVLSGTFFAIGFAYLVRFFAVPSQPIQAGLMRVCSSLDEASCVLGRRPMAGLLRINVPIMQGTLFAAAMLVFVDVLKELPLTMILRPANFDTLATTAFSLAKEGRIEECSVPSLIIVMAGTAGLMVLNRFMRPVAS